MELLVATFAYFVVEAVLWTCIADDAGDSSFSRSMDAPIVKRWRRQHRWILAILFVLAVVCLVFVMAAAS